MEKKVNKIFYFCLGLFALTICVVMINPKGGFKWQENKTKSRKRIKRKQGIIHIKNGAQYKIGVYLDGAFEVEIDPGKEHKIKTYPGEHVVAVTSFGSGKSINIASYDERITVRDGETVSFNFRINSRRVKSNF